MAGAASERPKMLVSALEGKKTLIVNTIIGVYALLHPWFPKLPELSPDAAVALLALVNIGLRFLTKGPQTVIATK